MRCEDALSQTVLRWRDGRRTCLEELQEVLAAGGLLGGVTYDRALSVRLRPPLGAVEAYLRGGVVVELNGQAWPPSRGLAGRWVKAGEALVWVEKAAWEDGRMKIEG
ncbi:hypothetical protein FDZ74_15680 [bacterium]|nr:MAG: hypothetical protein FDZ74_15680 [bacterium]